MSDEKPPHQYKSEQNIKEVSGGTVIGQAIYYIKTHAWPQIVILVVILLVLFFGVLPENNRRSILEGVGIIPTITLTPSATPTSTPTPTPTPAPERMPANAFNVAVAGFGFRQEDGSVIQATIADDMSDIVLASISELPQIDYIRGWRDSGVGHILSSDPLEREKEAARIAEVLNADVVIYGTVSEDGFFNIFEPEFYITAEFAALEPELVGADRFGSPVEFVGNSDDQISAATDLQKRLAVLRSFLRGLALFISADFQASRETFEEAVEIDAEGLEVLYIFAGNAAIREENLEKAIELFNQALQIRPQYSRALVGRGSALYQMAIEKENEFVSDTDLSSNQKFRCTDTGLLLPENPELLAELALDCYHAAQLSQDKPPTADIDVKTAFGIGQVNVWLALHTDRALWGDVETTLSQVIQLYEDSEPQRQIRIQAFAAHANAWLGLRLLSIDGTNVDSVQQAVDYYKVAVKLLREDVNRSYNQDWINVYTQQYTELEDWLANRADGTAPLPTTTKPAPTPAIPPRPTLTPTAELVG